MSRIIEMVKHILKIFERREMAFDRRSIIRDLREIEKLLLPHPDLFDHKIVSAISRRFTLKFEGGINHIQKIVAESNIKMIMTNSWSSLDESWWEISKREYRRFFNNPNVAFLRGVVSPTVVHLEGLSNTSEYQYTLIKYETTISTIKTTLRESLELNGEIEVSLIESSVDLLKMFVEDIEKVKKDLHNLKEKERQAISDSLDERLKAEKEYVKKFLRGEQAS